MALTRRENPRPVAVLVLTRYPGGRMSGRKTVLATAAASLEENGWVVEAVVLSRTPPPCQWQGRPVHHVPLPGVARAALGGLAVLASGKGSLNETLFDSRTVRRRVARLVQTRDAALVVADGLRTSRAALASGPPVVVHLDDLLSDRYAALAGSADGADLLGFFAEQLPGLLRSPAQQVASRLLSVEARRADARERELARTAHAVAMTSRDEADELGRRTGRPVAALPMAVDVRAAGDPARAPDVSFVFLGLLDYPPNRAALRWWTESVRPALDALGGTDVQLTVIGHGSDPLGETPDPRIRFTGYVDDLGEELRRHRAMVAPILAGGGVKTKVLDGWSVGLPVVATRAGAAGLGPDGLLVADGPEAFARAVLRLRDDPTLATRIGEAGRSMLSRNWSSQALARRWADVVAPIVR